MRGERWVDWRGRRPCRVQTSSVNTTLSKATNCQFTGSHTRIREPHLSTAVASTVVLQSDVPTTDLSKNGKFQKRSDEWAGKPAGRLHAWRPLRRRCLLDPVPRTPPIKSPTIWSLSLTSSRTAGRLRQITTSPVSLKYFISRKQAVRFPPDPPASFGRVLNYVSA